MRLRLVSHSLCYLTLWGGCTRHGREATRGLRDLERRVAREPLKTGAYEPQTVLGDGTFGGCFGAAAPPPRRETAHDKPNAKVDDLARPAKRAQSAAS